MSQRRFWFSLQLSLIALLNVIGHIRLKNDLKMIFVSRFGESLFGFAGTLIGFPLGIFTDFIPRISDTLLGMFIFYAVAYYAAFFLLVSYISSHKKHWRVVAVFLLAFMALSFAGCSRVVEIPLIMT